MPEIAEKTRRGAHRWLAGEIMGTAMVAVILLWAAGTWTWTMAWVLTALYACWVIMNVIVLFPSNKELLAERAERNPPGAKTWDKVMMALFGLLTVLRLVVAGLDERWGWTAPLPAFLPLLAAVAVAAGFAMVSWGMASNAYFSKFVRIQGDRGHTVATDGAYRYVRHPGYVGVILVEVASGPLLDSLWSFAIGLVAAAIIVVRTAKEDATLHEELDGYRDYAAKVRYRLLPGVW